MKSGREKPLKAYHPWIFSGAVKDVLGNPNPGETVQILDNNGEFLAQGAISPHSQIRARIWNWNQHQEIDEDFIRGRIQNALKFRKEIGYDFPMRRLVHAESDRIPGLIVDQYDQTLVVQILSAGAEYWKDHIFRILQEESGAETIFERSDSDVRALEGMELRTGLISGNEPADLLSIEQDGLAHKIDIRNGHKTGYYLDQRKNRVLVGNLCAGKDVLDCFSYSGGFSLQALKNKAAKVTMIDDSARALDLAGKLIEANNFSPEKCDQIEGDVFKVLRTFRDSGRNFDLIILDPPKFAPTSAHADRAARGYKDINLLAFKLLRPGGILATFSCSGGISQEFFLRILSGAAKDAGVNARIQSYMGQSEDHSANLSFPEGTYLKGFAIYVDKEEV